MSLSSVKIGVVGAGKMAGALVRSWVGKQMVTGEQVDFVYIATELIFSPLFLSGDYCKRPIAAASAACL